MRDRLAFVMNAFLIRTGVCDRVQSGALRNTKRGLANYILTDCPACQPGHHRHTHLQPRPWHQYPPHTHEHTTPPLLHHRGWVHGAGWLDTLAIDPLGRVLFREDAQEDSLLCAYRLDLNLPTPTTTTNPHTYHPPQARRISLQPNLRTSLQPSQPAGPPACPAPSHRTLATVAYEVSLTRAHPSSP